MISFTDSNFEEEVNSEEVVVVDFFADWCKPCGFLTPIYTKVAAALSQQAKFGKLDIELNHLITEKLSIGSLPTILIFKKGHIVNRLVGLISEEKLLKAVQDELKHGN